ncbi:hypothetical protein FACS1894124_0790 [Spirochaetia bacterium]|nr:hypothetical protein FACS1894124_0790 [Spirochaetia bacterium]
MLERDCRISKGMKGIDPERPLKDWPAMEEKWPEAHPEITPEEREEMRVQAAIARASSPLKFRAKEP